MIRKLSIPALLLAVLLLVPAADAFGALLPTGVTFKAPQTPVFHTVPLNDRQIAVDGAIGEQEWFYSTAFIGFINNTGSEYSSRQTAVYTCYTADALCLGFVSDAPSDPAAERIVAALQPASELYVIVIDANGAVESKAASLGAGVTAKSTVADGKWKCEVRIPFSAIGTARPADGVTWKANFARVFASPYADTSWGAKLGTDPFSYKGNELGVLQFKEQTLYYKITSLGRIDQRRMRSEGTVYEKPSSEDTGKRNFTWWFPLFTRGNWEMGFGNATEYKRDEVTPWYVCVGPGKDDEDIAGQYREGEAITFRLTHGEWVGPDLYKSELFPAGKPFPPMQLTTYKILPKDQMILWLDTSGLKPNHDGKSTLTLSTYSPSDKLLECKTVAGAQRGEYEFELNAGLFKLGSNKMVGILSDSGGKEIGRSERIVTRPDAAQWKGNKIGISSKVPSPFEPVRVDGRSVRVWGREYVLGKGTVLDGIVTRGKSILSRPIALEAGLDGRNIPFKGSDWKFTRKKDTDAVSVSTLSGDNLDIKLKNTIEFDGMTRVDFTIVPKTKGARLDSLVLRVPIKAEYARYLNWTTSTSGGLRGAFGYGNFPEKGFENSFLPFVWLGDEDRGLLWFAEWPLHWNLKNRNTAIKANRTDGTAELAVTMIDQPTTFEKPVTITFGLQAGPVRPLPENWRGFSKGLSYLSSYPDYYGYNPETTKIVAKEMDKRISEGGKVTLYAYPHSLTTHVPAYEFYSNGWRVSGPHVRGRGSIQLDSMCDETDFVDFNVWAEKEALDINGNKHVGLVYDLSWASQCVAPNHPHSKEVSQPGAVETDVYGQPINRDGTLLPKTIIFAQRDYMKRIYTLFRQRFDQTYIVAHSSGNTIQLPLFSFCDGAWDGEQHAYWVRDYISETPPHEWRAVLTCRQFGMIPLSFPEMRYPKDLFKETQTFITMSALHDRLIFDGFIDGDLKKAHEDMRWDFGIGEPDVKFIPYWEDNGKLFQSGNPDLLTSAWIRPNKALIAVGNMGDKDVDEDITIDFRSLNIEPKDVKLMYEKTTTPTSVVDGKVRLRMKAKSPIFILVN